LNVTPGRHSTGTVGLLTHTPTVPVLCLPGVTFNVSLRFLASSCLTACDPGTKGHSVSRQKTHTMPGIGRPLPRTTYYDSSADYSVDDSLNRVEYFSNAVMEDQYDAAVRSRGRDDALLRNMDATIPPSSHASSCSRDFQTGHSSKRFQSLPPRESRLSSSLSTSKSLVPYYQTDRMLKSLPSPSSFLSNRISRYLTADSSIPLRMSSNISYESLLPDPIRPNYSDIGSKSSYRSYVTEPSIYSPLSRSTRGYTPLSSYRRSVSRYYPDDDDDDYSYRRSYRSLSRPRALTYDDPDTNSYSYRTRYNRSLSRPRAITYDDDDDESYSTYSSYSTYRPSRRSDSSYLKLSSYDGPYDGSYEADMADMYDYVPFGPSTSGILELTPASGVDDYSEPRRTLTYSSDRYSPSRYSTTDRYSPIPDRAPSVASISHQESKPSENTMIQSLVSNTAARAKAVLADSKLPYKNASLVLSVEGNALSEDGKNKYGFKYYPPPIPLTGGQIGLDERILGITALNNSPADSFLGDYLTKLRSMRSEERDEAESGRGVRGSSVSSTRSLVPRSSSPYSHRTIRMPLNISGRESSVPVSSYRSRLDDGQSHRVDVFPLVETEASVPAGGRYQLPMYNEKGDSKNKLTLLDRISIKAAIIGSRVESDDGSKVRRPKTQFASNKLRELKIQDIERKYN